MKTKTHDWEVVVLGCVAMLAAMYVPVAQDAHADGVEPKGVIVEIAPASNNDLPIVGDEVVAGETIAEPEVEKETSFWIGVRGRNVDEPVLRTQFQLAGDMGVVVEEVVKESPAAEAGLRKHDILLRANGEPLQSMEQLSKLVRSGEGKAIELLLLRLAKQETISIVPQRMPAEMAAQKVREIGEDNMGIFQDLLQGDGNVIRMFPQGLNAQIQMNNALPNGYSVSVTRQNDQPAQVTVKQGDQSWTVVEGDEEALEQLPEEIRGAVESMLNNQKVNFNFRNLPNFGRDFPMDIPGGLQRFDFGNEQRDKVLQRMRELEERLQKLQQQIDEGVNR